jgi:hypothetical protein
LFEMQKQPSPKRMHVEFANLAEHSCYADQATFTPKLVSGKLG